MQTTVMGCVGVGGEGVELGGDGAKTVVRKLDLSRFAYVVWRHTSQSRGC